MSSEFVFQVAGLLLCGAAFAWVTVGFAQGVQRISLSRRRFERSQALFQAQLHAARTPTLRAHKRSWNGLRKFRIKWKVSEANDCHSFFLVPHDEKPLPPFMPGQYLTLSTRLAGEPKPVVRCYSLSEAPQEGYYRITVKKVVHADGSFGRMSAYLNDAATDGDLVDVGAPQGPFYLDPVKDTPVVLLAAGVGITPIMSMINAIVAEGTPRQVYVFFGVRHGAEHIFQEPLANIARENDHIHLTTCYSAPTERDAIGRDFDVHGRVTMEVIQQTLPSNNFEFYLCGPSAFTSDLIDGLTQWNVPAESIHYEAFGPASPKRQTDASTSTPVTCQVRFTQSDKTVPWTEGTQSLLELAEANGIAIDSGCRTGSCGTCATAVKSGRFKHTETPSTSIAGGICLACIAVPEDREISLDA